jgi:hypothetical protein
LPIRLTYRGATVAETTLDAAGAFRMEHLAGGVHQIMLQTPHGPALRYCRLWPWTCAPPGAAAWLDFPITREGIVRGQSPMPAATIQEVLLWTALAAGAIAVPVIYSTKNTPRIPASP